MQEGKHRTKPSRKKEKREITQVDVLRVKVKSQRGSWKKIHGLKTIVKFLKTS